MRIDAATGLPAVYDDQRWKVVRAYRAVETVRGFEPRPAFQVLLQQRGIIGGWHTIAREYVRTGKSLIPDGILTREGIKATAEKIARKLEDSERAKKAFAEQHGREAELLGVYPPKRLEKGE